MHRKPHILWADDEIVNLKSHIMFLEGRGYEVTPVNSGNEALELVREALFDIVFLDENMPGLSGIETLQRIKEHRPSLPIVMITKSEEEHIMEEAIGSKISDYLIKPVNPNQILLAVKKNLDEKRLVSEKALMDYQRAFREIGMELGGRLQAGDWARIYQRLIRFQLELEKTGDTGMTDILSIQLEDANRQFGRFIEENYEDWMTGQADDAPVMSHQLLPHYLPRSVAESAGRPLYLVVIDNLRWDQWRVLEPLITQRFSKVREEAYFSMLPTATQYARNALFAGLTPAEIARTYPQWWKSESEKGSKNASEHELFGALAERMGIEGRVGYHKIAQGAAGRKLLDQFHVTKENAVTAIVYNFVDMISHARTEMEVLKELAEDESAYRSLTVSWFEHSALWDLLGAMADEGGRVIITTDHGTMRVNQAVQIKGERNTNSNLRYKVGRNLGYDAGSVFSVKDPEKLGLPRPQVSSEYVFAREKDFLVYPNNQNHFAHFFRDSFQHGGISMEEVIIPWIELDPKQ